MLFSRQYPRGFHYQRYARGIVVSARRVAGRVHDIAYAAIDVPCYDHDMGRIAGAALDTQHILDNDAVGRAGAVEAPAWALDHQPKFGEFRRHPVTCRTDAAFRVGGGRQCVAGAEANQCVDRAA